MRYLFLVVWCLNPIVTWCDVDSVVSGQISQQIDRATSHAISRNIDTYARFGHETDPSTKPKNTFLNPSANSDFSEDEKSRLRYRQIDSLSNTSGFSR